jgi:hypothetical protein
MRIEDMNEGVQILLARMKAHPEEFMGDGKWKFVSDAFITLSHAEERLPFLDKEEILALQAGLKQMYRDKFTALILSKLTDGVQGELF